ncbi:competence type IV pilus minor pilin ComGE [Streptococcus marmotae]|uniref:competence type IV pilus minor pilin ComGE n=1 Tax=Streptococcus marmotae TaxID=1825069 RepID=UPI001F41D5E6|nr:competence type IV pilus minor pilin ComGE [Streptococcus marmotae]
MTLAIFAMITSLLLSGIQQSRRQQVAEMQQQELLSLAKMAVQTRQDRFSLNDLTVEVVRDEQQIRVYHDGKELLHVAKE